MAKKASIMTPRIKQSIYSFITANILLGILLTPICASAQGEEGRRNTTIGLGALSGYLFTRGGNKTGAFAAAAATGVAYKRYDDSVKARHKRERLARARKHRLATAKSLRLAHEHRLALKKQHNKS